jgi:hypothetical protein
MHTGYDDLVWEDLGDHWERAIVVLEKGDTAWNPGSTKHVIYGPCTVTYERHPSGITGYIH